MSVGSSTSNDLDENGTNGITNGTNRSTTDSNGTGKSFSEALILILASANPQYDKRVFIEFPEKYKITTSCVQKLFFVYVLTFKTICCTQH